MDPKTENVTLIFIFEGNRLAIHAKKSDKIEDVFLRFCTKAQVNRGDVKFYFNSAEFKIWGKTVEQLDLRNLLEITVVKEIDLRGA